MAALTALAPLAAVAQPSISDRSIVSMIEVTDLSSVAISPDGRWVAYRSETASVARNAYDLAWHVVALDGRTPPRRVADAGAGTWPDGQIFAAPPLWSADSRWIYYRAARDGAAQLWRASADGRGVEQVTHDAADIVAFALVPGSSDVVYSVGATRAAIAAAEAQGLDNGVLIDRQVDPNRPLYHGGRIDGRAATERLTGSWFAHGGLLADQPRRYVRVLNAGGAARVATAAEAALVAPGVTPLPPLEGRRVLAATPSGDARGVALVLADGIHGELAVTRGEGRADAIWCDAPVCRGQSVVHADWVPGADALVATLGDGAGNHRLVLWHPATDVTRSIAAPGGMLDGGRDGTHGCALSRVVAVCVTADADAPPRLVRIDLGSGHVATLADPNAGLRRRLDRHFARLAWTSPAGDRFTAQWLAPAGTTGPAPLFVTYYVCNGFLRGGTGDEFPLRQLAAAGIGVLCINRAAAGSEQTDNEAEYHRALAGIKAGIDLLDCRGIVDRRRIGMGGLSFGAEIAMWTAMRSDLLAAVATATSLLTPTFYWFAAMPGRDAPALMKRVWGLDAPDVAPERWRALSPAMNAASIQTPLLMQAPEQEYRANLELAARLDRVGTPVELWAFAGETHIKYQPVHKFAAFRRYLDWFRFWLQDHVDPDPARAAQYRRWRSFARQPGWHDDVPPSQASSHNSVSASERTR
ncbi:Atxe2 family lasso peptide isopeptidase [Sphingomonas sp. 1P08PE]|uniref:Atxe2 family lasso peptide isopeptidase n=1 Tax=Sphingomonas sp. 1P08PE TaxID=554122 RepID=UPI0039A36C4E